MRLTTTECPLNYNSFDISVDKILLKRYLSGNDSVFVFMNWGT